MRLHRNKPVEPFFFLEVFTSKNRLLFLIYNIIIQQLINPILQIGKTISKCRRLFGIDTIFRLTVIRRFLTIITKST